MPLAQFGATKKHTRPRQTGKYHIHQPARDFSSAMASELRRPPTRTGSGSRPPTSRFQEGSMNDRTSAAPPAQFMGPEQLKEYENQFYAERPATREARRPRPFSASGKLQAVAVPRHADTQEPQPQKHTVTHKKSMGFFGRVRDVLFHRGGQHGPAALKQEEMRRKHSSLQEPLQHPQAPPPPRPDYLQHAGRTQSVVNFADMFPNPRGGGVGDRPSREEVLASYNQLVASGFFQSHAIQSTRHAAPTSVPAGVGGRQAPALPAEQNQTAPRPPVRIPSIQATARPSSLSPMPRPRLRPTPSPSPNPQNRNSREYSTGTAAAPPAPRTSLSSLFRPSIPDLHTKDSWYTLRGRKRTREETPVVTPEPQTSSSTSYFAQPLKRVAKKLREMPSSSSQLNEKATAIKNNNTVRMAQESSDEHTSADGIMRLVPSISTGGSLHPNERPIRLRSPSPALPEMIAAGHTEQSRERPVREPVISAATRARRPRRTFSYTVTQTARGRTRAAERQREREMKRELQRRGPSATCADNDNDNSNNIDNSSRMPTRSSRQPTLSPNPLGQWQRVSVEDTIIHRDSSDSTWSQWD
ncbi:hypothetical protein CHU98_g7439, partial [Xylaria longipes]